MDDLARRLRDAGTALEGLRDALIAGEPWPLSDSWGHTPESMWGPREVLGHVDEMLTYWVDELDRVRGGDGTAPVPFGRIATDQSRLDRIDADRRLDTGALLDDIGRGLDRAASFAESLAPEGAARVGVHPSRGEITVGESIERFLVTHLDEHVVQLRASLDESRTG